MGETEGAGAREVRRSTRALLVMLALLSLYTVADLASKEWALDTLSRARTGQQPPICQPDEQGYMDMQRLPTPPTHFIAGILDMHYAENCGAAFGMLRSAPGWVRALVFGVAAIGASIVLIVMFVRGSGGKPFAVAVPLILSGAIGNLSDRVRHGFVVDFIQVDPKLFEYPTFNVADIAITIGVALLLIDGMKKPQTEPLRAAAEEPEKGAA
ncbi:MAG: Lipoprotein signal peptidase [Myxococcaceae bacterium]|nr:Lipoprotein signal peptidase [Myxococcaceae bacterium]